MFNRIKLTDQLGQSQFNTSCHIRAGGFLLLELLISCIVALLMTFIMTSYQAQCIITGKMVVDRWNALHVLHGYSAKMQRKKDLAKRGLVHKHTYAIQWHTVDSQTAMLAMTAHWENHYGRQQVALFTRLLP